MIHLLRVTKLGDSDPEEEALAFCRDEGLIWVDEADMWMVPEDAAKFYGQAQ